MPKQLLVLIGGSDEQNGDYSRVLRAIAGRRGSFRWSSLKSAQPGDRALIYFQRPHSALIAKATVLEPSIKGSPGDYAYRSKIGQFELLPNPLSISDLRRLFPRWGWPRYPRGKAIVPRRYADELWARVHEPSKVQILIANAGFGLRQVRNLATSGKSAAWSAPKLTRKGDTVFF